MCVSPAERRMFRKIWELLFTCKFRSLLWLIEICWLDIDFLLSSYCSLKALLCAKYGQCISSNGAMPLVGCDCSASLPWFLVICHVVETLGAVRQLLIGKYSHCRSEFSPLRFINSLLMKCCHAAELGTREEKQLGMVDGGEDRRAWVWLTLISKNL